MKFKPKDFDTHCSECDYVAAEQANTKLQEWLYDFECDSECDACMNNLALVDVTREV
jgi:hypothetical protein